MPADHAIGPVRDRGERGDREPRRIGGEDRLRRGARVEVAEHLELEVEPLRHALDHDVAGDRLVERRRELEPRERGVGVGARRACRARPRARARSGPTRRSRRPRSSAFASMSVHFVADPRHGQRLGDAAAHHAGSDHAYAHVCHGALLRFDCPRCATRAVARAGVRRCCSGVGRDRLREVAQRAADLGARPAAEQLHHGAPVERERDVDRRRGRERALDRAAQPLERARARRRPRRARRSRPRAARAGPAAAPRERRTRRRNAASWDGLRDRVDRVQMEQPLHRDDARARLAQAAQDPHHGRTAQPGGEPQLEVGRQRARRPRPRRRTRRLRARPRARSRAAARAPRSAKRPSSSACSSPRSTRRRQPRRSARAFAQRRARAKAPASRPRVATSRTARSARSGSSAKRSARAADAAQPRRGRVGAARERVEHASLGVGRERVQREVAVRELARRFRRRARRARDRPVPRAVGSTRRRGAASSGTARAKSASSARPSADVATSKSRTGSPSSSARHRGADQVSLVSARGELGEHVRHRGRELHRSGVAHARQCTSRCTVCAPAGTA